MGTCKRFLEKQKKSDCLLRPLDILNLFNCSELSLDILTNYYILYG